MSHSWQAFPKVQLDSLIVCLHQRGYRVIGPIAEDGAIVYAEIDGASQLPKGWTDQQAPGRYRLVPRDDQAYFGYTVAPQSWKRHVHPPRKTLFRALKTEDSLRFEEPEQPPPTAFLGVRACELAALGILDKVFAEAPLKRPLIISVECMEAGDMCFCTTMDAGPQVRAGYDLVLNELAEVFLIRSGSPIGEEILGELSVREAELVEIEEAQSRVQQTAESMPIRMKTEGIRDLLLGNLEHPQWEEVASRCLGCANCTMVCPTCFCTTVEDHTDLVGASAERTQHWDSCFNLDFTFTNGHPVRQSLSSRYRQWLTHKLASWHDQFGSSGCVGCARCITWCPVGIDLTEEVAAIAANPTKERDDRR